MDSLVSAQSAAPLLQMEQICKRFGATNALRGVSLELRPGQALALIGENGAGKSTLMKVLSGAHSPDSGYMELDGQRYSPRGPHAARLAGVAMIYQELNLASDLTVEENVMLGQERAKWGVVGRDTQRKKIRAALDRLGHADIPLDARVGTLPVGTQQLVEIARALVTSAKVIVFDEPTSSLGPADVERLFQTITRLLQQGLGVIYISHFLNEVRRVCDSYTVLRDGETVDGGNLADVGDDYIVSKMAGRGIKELYPQVPHEIGDVVLSLTSLSGDAKPYDVSFDLRRGEILGLAGLIGAGRTELLRAIFALDPVRSGRVRVGTAFPGATPKARIRAGLGYVSEDRAREGLAQARSIADNITYSRLTPYSRWGWLNLSERRHAVSRWIERLEIKAASSELAVETLSGGTQQKVALARVLHQRADILLLDEPTRGIDVGTKATIYRLIGELSAVGHSILFVSSYFPELLHVCDRIGVMSQGRLRDIRPASKWTEQSLLSRAMENDTE